MIASLTPRPVAIQNAQQIINQRPVYLDTETTGIRNIDEIIEIGIIDFDGTVLFESYVRPTQPVPLDSQSIHHITDEMVKNARAWPIIWSTVRGIVNNRVVATYNADFDLRLMRQSLTRYGLLWKDNLNMFCVMKLYAQFRSECDSRRGSYKYVSLEDAGKACKLTQPNAHRAVADIQLTRALLEYIAGS
jgi:DNA polymerase III subunit epsilon